MLRNEETIDIKAISLTLILITLLAKKKSLFKPDGIINNAASRVDCSMCHILFLGVKKFAYSSGLGEVSSFPVGGSAAPSSVTQCKMARLIYQES